MIEKNLRAMLDAVIKRSSDGGGGAKLEDHIVFSAGDALRVDPLPELSTEKILAMGIMRFTRPTHTREVSSSVLYMKSSPTSSITLTGGSLSHRPAKGWTMSTA